MSRAKPGMEIHKFWIISFQIKLGGYFPFDPVHLSYLMKEKQVVRSTETCTSSIRMWTFAAMSLPSSKKLSAPVRVRTQIFMEVAQKDVRLQHSIRLILKQ